MQWWIAGLTYLMGWGISFRTIFLRFRDETQRWWNEADKLDKKYRESTYTDRKWMDSFQATLLSIIWPLILLTMAARFILFPRGVKTRFDREQEAEEKLAKEKKKLKEAERLLKEAGINY